jgi:hypothetical protein
MRRGQLADFAANVPFRRPAIWGCGCFPRSSLNFSLGTVLVTDNIEIEIGENNYVYPLV